MKKALAFLATGWLAFPLWAEKPPLCVPHETIVIEEELHCVDTGIAIQEPSEGDGLKVACMQDAKVKSQCGPDGRLTRLRAYTEWFNKLKRFEDQCNLEEGTFGFLDPAFVEPQNEAYCLQAVPETSANMFEEPLCNYRSVCPAVTVFCDRPCSK